MRLVYLGSPAMSVPPLEALIEAGHDVALVVSNPDRRRGRRGDPEPTPVKAAALHAGIPVTSVVDDVLAVGAELAVVVAFGRIIAAHVLAELPMVNLHFSLLPRWRGAAPVERALLAGDERTGVCVMDVEETLDTGGVYARAEVPITATTTAAQLRGELVELGSRLLVDTLAAGLGTPEPQAGEGVTYADKIGPADRELHWEESAEQCNRRVRVGGAWTTYAERRFKVIAAEVLDDGVLDGGTGPPGTLNDGIVACGDGSLRLLEVQPEGRGALSYASWANGARPAPGERLGT